jgi:Protein of unknown function (DUF3592)
MTKRRSVSSRVVRSKSVWFVGIFLRIGLFILAVDIHLWADEWRFWRGGSADGTVIGTNMTTSRTPRVRRSRTYSVVYEFQPALGKRLQGASEIPLLYWTTLKSGDRVRVSYFRGAPDHNRLSYALSFLPALAMLLLGAAFTACGAMGEYFVLMEIYQKYVKKRPVGVSARTPLS